MSNLFLNCSVCKNINTHKEDSQIKWLINTQWSHKWLNYTNNADMLSFNTMLLMTYLLNIYSRAFPLVSLHKRKSYVLHKHGNNFMEIQCQQAILRKQREQDKFVLVLQNASLSCQPVSKCVSILLNGYLLNICTFRQGREWVCPNIKLSNLSVCGSKTTITVDLFPFSISLSKNTLVQFVKCHNKLML